MEAQRLFEKKRKKTMNMEFLQGYTTFMLSPYFHFHVKNKNYIFERVTKATEGAVVEFLNREGRKKDFFPVIESLSQFTDLNPTDFYILKDGEEIVAAGALWKQTAYRQYIVTRYSGLFKFGRVFNPILKALGYIQLPKENEVLDFPMLSFFISKDDNEEYYKAFLNHINPIIKKEYGMFVIGISANNFAHGIFRKVRNIHFDTKIYEIEFILGNGKKADVNGKNIWLECGLL